MQTTAQQKYLARKEFHMHEQYIDYREELRDLYDTKKIQSRNVGYITDGFNFFDWCERLEADYRSRYPEQKLISYKKLWEFAIGKTK